MSDPAKDENVDPKEPEDGAEAPVGEAAPATGSAAEPTVEPADVASTAAEAEPVEPLSEPAAASPRDEPAVPPVDAAEPSPTEATPVTSPSTEIAEPLETAAAAEPPAESETADEPAVETAAAAEDQPEPEPERSPETMRLLAAKEAGVVFEGKVIGWNRGGFHIALEGTAAFCPRSMMEIGNPRKPQSYLDQVFEFRIFEVDEPGRRVVVSRQELLREERQRERKEVRASLVPGAVLEGRVDSLTDFGAFVQLGGGIKGLVHLSELSRRRVERPDEVVKVGETVQVKVLKVEKKGDRVSLSMKELEPDPWKDVEELHPRGSEFRGTVARRTDFGLFVEISEGLEGLVHVSQLPIGGDLGEDRFAPGSEIEGWVREVDAGRRRLALTLRAVPADDPWKDVASRYEEGSVVEGHVEQATRFGFFVELEPGLTGLLPFSEVSAPAGRRKEQTYHPGQDLKVQIMQLDPRRRRISLGLEGSKAEGSKADYRAYVKQQRDEGPGLGALAAAFEKLKGESS